MEDHPMARRALVLALVPLTACSIFSGWSDLQDGPEPAVAAADAMVAELPPPQDASPDVEEASTLDANVALPPLVLCGNVTCEHGLGCCSSLDPETNICSTRENCSRDLWFTCTTSDACSAGVCCLDNDFRASCAATCTEGGMVLCSPAAPARTCAATQSCLPWTDNLFYCSERD